MKKKLKITALSILAILLLFAGYFFTIRNLDSKVLESKDIIPASEKPGGSPLLVPSYFVEGERFYIKIPIGGGDTIMGFGDTGGGVSMLMPDTKNKNNINSKLRTALIKGIMPLKYVLFSDLVQDPNFPKPYPLRSFVLRNPFMRITSPYLIIPPMEDELKLMTEVQPEMDAFLGQTFFMNKSWTIDYPNKEVWVNTPLNNSLLDHPKVQKIGFKKNSNYDNIFGHPSMTIEIDGDTIDVLFDTGASLVLSKDGKKQMETVKKTIGGSFIAASIFNKWRDKHPDWKYYPKADLAGDVIEVPIVKIGGHEVGPVLFAKRRDENWSEGMIASMDKIVKGAIGGSALKYLKVTIDYNSELIKFERSTSKVKS
jgi:hypothetical protein